MTGRHALPPGVHDGALLDQVQACHANISRYLVWRASRPLPADQAADVITALQIAYGLLNDASAILLQIEIEAGRP